MTIRIQPAPRPGKLASDYDKQLAARLSKLAAAGSSGVAPVSGPIPGAVYFEAGRVVFAECSETPNVSELLAEPGVPGGGGLSAALARSEATIDAVLELLSNRSASGKFRPGVPPPSGTEYRLEFEELLEEVARRRRVLRQLAGFSADSPLHRSGRLPIERVQVTAAQWALIVRTYPGSTPRDLAWALKRSVFGTTTEVYRLIGLGLLSATGQRPARADEVSFIEALAGATASPRATRPATSKAALSKAIAKTTRRRGGS